ncbi:uncharacterized protein LOC114762855 isoform X1 [Neltuma alba]|uniref:uncharacterized protein LOC114762855 isoform X1 n=1 Tax=Neltuma alba TaxID=207710 RepID=UPI0010A4EFA1|nr:uncharacterized protein LOC114762855 isoform X1 [Prosopis alba]
MAASMASMAGRRTSVRFLSRTSTTSCPRGYSFFGSPQNSSSIPLRTPIAHSSPLRYSTSSEARNSQLLRRELSSFKPEHSAIASAYLVSKLPCNASTPNEGRFANYISPI